MISAVSNNVGVATIGNINQQTGEVTVNSVNNITGTTTIIVTGSPEETQLPWPKVQRRIAQLIQEARFYTEEEQDRFDDIDPLAIREALEERGIVNGQVADPEKLDNAPFIQQVMSDRCV